MKTPLAAVMLVLVGCGQQTEGLEKKGDTASAIAAPDADDADDADDAEAQETDTAEDTTATPEVRVVDAVVTLRAGSDGTTRKLELRVDGSRRFLRRGERFRVVIPTDETALGSAASCMVAAGITMAGGQEIIFGLPVPSLKRGAASLKSREFLVPNDPAVKQVSFDFTLLSCRGGESNAPGRFSVVPTPVN